MIFVYMCVCIVCVGFRTCDSICLVLYYTKGGTIGWFCFLFQAEDGIRDLVRSRGLGDVYKRQS